MIVTIYMSLVLLTLVLCSYYCFRKLAYPLLGTLFAALLSLLPPLGWLYLFFLYNTPDLEGYPAV
ncbi:hypothetical protein [Ferrimonas pelagia]|uniref:Uncharacterized protein n=1 Tax=Ferrimonas pelagia TaxID=1177826 RepID=A0ABP9EYH9_9GAMM